MSILIILAILPEAAALATPEGAKSIDGPADTIVDGPEEGVIFDGSAVEGYIATEGTVEIAPVVAGIIAFVTPAEGTGQLPKHPGLGTAAVCAYDLETFSWSLDLP